MKKVKAIGAVVVCLCLIAGIFAGCSKISFEGKWKSTIDLTEEFCETADMSGDAEMGQYYDKLNIPLSVDVIYTFYSDNSYTCAADEEKFKADFDVVAEKYINYMIEGMYKYAEAQGMSRDEFDEYYEEENGVSVLEDITAEFEAEVPSAYYEMLDELTETVPQHLGIKDDRFYHTDDNGNELGYQTFTLEGDTLTITGEYDMQDNPVDEEEYPIVLTKMAEQQNEYILYR